MTDWINADAAAQRLGIKRATLYAYVSRGVLVRRRSADGRGSLFDAAEIERLARRGRPRRAPGTTDLVIESALTEITDDRLSFRGHEVTTLAATHTLETIATLLWTGDLPPPPPTRTAPHTPLTPQPTGTAPRTPPTPPATNAGPHTPPVPPATDTALHTPPAPPLPPGPRTPPAPPATGVRSPTPPASGPPPPASAWWWNPGSTATGGGQAPDPPPAGGLGPPVAEPWHASPEALAVGSAAQAALPARALPLERLQVIVPALAAADPLRLHLDAPAVMAVGRTLIAGMTDCLPLASLGERESAEGGIAERLWFRLCPNPPTPGLLTALRAALVLLADHELAASTLAARVAASVRADPYAVVATGLGALGGPLHGGASLGAESMLAGAASPGDAPRVVGELLRLTGRVPGFGHFVYRTGDPRAVCLLRLIRQGAPDSPRLAIADAVLAEMRQRALPEPNIDLALAVLTDVAGLISGAGEAIFAVARTAGWIAHALEEYARATPLRPRAVYTGPPAAPATLAGPPPRAGGGSGL